MCGTTGFFTLTRPEILHIIKDRFGIELSANYKRLNFAFCQKFKDIEKLTERHKLLKLFAGREVRTGKNGA